MSRPMQNSSLSKNVLTALAGIVVGIAITLAVGDSWLRVAGSLVLLVAFSSMILIGNRLESTLMVGLVSFGILLLALTFVFVLYWNDVFCKQIDSNHFAVIVSTNGGTVFPNHNPDTLLLIPDATQSINVDIRSALTLECSWWSPYGLKLSTKGVCQQDINVAQLEGQGVINVAVFPKDCRLPYREAIVVKKSS